MRGAAARGTLTFFRLLGTSGPGMIRLEYSCKMALLSNTEFTSYSFISRKYQWPWPELYIHNISMMVMMIAMIVMILTSPASSLSSSWWASQASWSAGSEKSSIMKKFIPTWFCYFWSCSWWWWPWPRWQYQYLHKSCYLRKWSSALVGPERSKTRSWFNVV